MHDLTPIPGIPFLRRVRHELRRRELRVDGVERITPHMIRVTLGGEDLADFTSAAPDDHVKLFFPQPDGSVEKRDYTPLSFDPVARRLVIDFVDHEGGPASAWARAARPGDSLAIGGPRGSTVIEGPITSWVLIGDETALPAIARRLAELPAEVAALSVAAVTDAAEEQALTSPAALEARWVHRPAHEAANPAPLLDAVRNVALTPGTFVWVAAEAGVARAIRQYLLEERDWPMAWIKASGYWAAGQADGAMKDLG